MLFDFRFNFTSITDPIDVIPTTLAPANQLRVIDGIQGVDIEIIESGTVVKQTALVTSDVLIGGSSLFSGDWAKASIQKHDKFIGAEALSIQFTGSDTTAANYATDSDAGWNQEDLSLATTNMWVKVKYTNAGYYNGELVDTIATIKVTPFKNRTPGASWANENYSNISYFPIIQLSEVLAKGWAWQNVNEFDVNMEFYLKGETTSISFPNTTFDDFEGVYYTINSLNLAKIFDDGVAVGLEYVWPKEGTVSKVYSTEGSNIVTEYYGGPDAGTQYAYNGGTNE